MKRWGSGSVPVVGTARPAGAVRRESEVAPPPAPRPAAAAAAAPWVAPPTPVAVAERARSRRSRWRGVLLMLLGFAGLAAALGAAKEGDAMLWGKRLVLDVQAQLATAPDWVAAAAADLAVLARPTLLVLVGGAAVLTLLARRGLLDAVFAAVVFVFAHFFAQGMAQDASAPVFLVVLVWGWLFAAIGGGLMPLLGIGIGLAAALGRVAIGDESPVAALAATAAALMLWGFARAVLPARR